MKYILILIMLIPLNLYSRSKYSKYTYIPQNAYDYLPQVYEEVARIIPELSTPYYFPALIEHESCICIRPSRRCRRCFNPRSRLKTWREEGAGLFQLTRTFYRNGRVKWDIVRTLKRENPELLSELNWYNIYDRPDLQIRAGLILWKSNWNRLSSNIDEENRRRFADAIFNGGWKFFNRERKTCGLRYDCDPNVWYGNVADISSGRNRRALYSGKTAWQINRRHVRDVEARMNKYENDYNNNIDIYSKEVEPLDFNSINQNQVVY